MTKTSTDPPAFRVRPAQPEEAGAFFAQTLEQDAQMGAIGHVRMDFGKRGTEFWHTWHPRGREELNSPKFKAELQQVVDKLRETVLDVYKRQVQRESGSIVCIEKGDTLRFDVDHKVRLIDIKEYAYGGYPFLRGFISGLHAGNFDITHIFIDNLYKLSQDSDPKETENFLDWCSVFSAENSVAFTLTIAGEAKDAPEYIARYMD